MALVETLIDNFNDNSIDVTKWTAYENGTYTVDEINEQLEIYMSGDSGYNSAGLVSVDYWDLETSSFFVKVVDAGDMGLDNYQVDIIARVNWNYSETVDWEIVYGSIYARQDGGTVASDTYVPATHKYLRIRESSGTIYWDYSANGIDWTNFTSAANSWDAGDINYVNIYLDIWGGYCAGSATVILDDFNVLPSGYSGQLMMIT